MEKFNYKQMRLKMKKLIILTPLVSLTTYSQIQQKHSLNLSLGYGSYVALNNDNKAINGIQYRYQDYTYYLHNYGSNSTAGIVSNLDRFNIPFGIGAGLGWNSVDFIIMHHLYNNHGINAGYQSGINSKAGIIFQLYFGINFDVFYL